MDRNTVNGPVLREALVSPRRDYALLAGQKHVLELIASGASLFDTLTALIRFIESQEDDLVCSILVLGDDRQHFCRSIGPSLGRAFHEALDGAPITPPYLGSCGEAAHLGVPVLSPDIARDERYSESWRQLMLARGLKACCSLPVCASDGRVLASLAMYRSKPCDPGPAHPELIEIATHLAGIALERAQSEASLREGNEFNRRLLQSTQDCVKILDLDGCLLWMNESGQKALEIDTFGSLIGKPWPALFRNEAEQRLAQDAIATAAAGSSGRFAGYCPTTKGAAKWWESVVTPIPSAAGKPDRLLVISRDITQRKSAEQRLVESEERLAAEVAAMHHLQAVSMQLIQQDDIDGLYRQIVEAAAEIMRSEMASIQMLHRERNELRLLAHKGFHPVSAEFWKWVGTDSASSCSTALASGARAIVDDIEACAEMTGTRDWEEYCRSGIRAVQSTPLVSRSGQLLGMLSTHWCKPHRPAAAALQRLDVLARQAADLIERKRSEEALAAQTQQLEALNDASKSFSKDLDLERIVQAVTDSATKLCGAQSGAFFYNVTDESGETYMLHKLSGTSRKEFAGIPMPRNTSLFAPTFAGSEIVRLADVRDDPRFGDNAPYHGIPEGHLPVVSYLAVPVVSQSGEVLGGLFFSHEKAGVFTQAAENLVAGIAAHAATAIDNARLLREAQSGKAHRTLLLYELSHRVKNTLATVQSVAMQTLKYAPTPEAFFDRFAARLIAFSQTHDLLMHSHWRGATLLDLVTRELAPYGSDGVSRWSVSGKTLQVNAKSALALGMALHELATNAAKYGALSTPAGQVDVSWRVGQGKLHLSWRERGGPAVAPIGGGGFGSRLIREGLAYELDAAVRLDFKADGVQCAIAVPLEATIEKEML